VRNRSLSLAEISAWPINWSERPPGKLHFARCISTYVEKGYGSLLPDKSRNVTANEMKCIFTIVVLGGILCQQHYLIFTGICNFSRIRTFMATNERPKRVASDKNMYDGVLWSRANRYTARKPVAESSTSNKTSTKPKRQTTVPKKNVSWNNVRERRERRERRGRRERMAIRGKKGNMVLGERKTTKAIKATIQQSPASIKLSLHMRTIKSRIFRCRLLIIRS
jgi:hypothetical protein